MDDFKSLPPLLNPLPPRERGYNDLHWPEKLFAHRLIFVMGKGGVGKTTMTVLLGRAASRLGRKTLLVELGDSDAIGGIFSQASLQEDPILLSKNLWGARVNPKAELEAYTRAHIPSSLIANRITRSRLFDYLFAATPGLKEVMSLGRIWRWEQAVDQVSLPLFDLIIVDSPATGHGLSLLRLPNQLVQMIRVGPIVSQINRLQDLFQDHEKTCLAMVSLPEELPVHETIEFYTTSESVLNIPVHVTFINSVWPATYTAEDMASLDLFLKSMRTESSESMLWVLSDAAKRHIEKRTQQEKYISQIASAIPCPVAEVPFCFANDLTLDDIDRISLGVFPFSAPKEV
jgi:anion-transporting  ArsA/GET3 family ATPase